MVWTMLMAIAVVAFIASLSYKRELIWSSIAFGGVLALVDLVVQSIGSYYHLWVTHGSAYSIGAVPIEVLVIAVLAGSIYTRLSTEVNPVLMGFVAAFGGTLIEYWLTTLNYSPLMATSYVPAPLEYMNWNPLYAFVTYLVVFTLLAHGYRKYMMKKYGG